MKKKQIIETLGRKEYLSQLVSGELECFRLLMDRLMHHDYPGMNQAALGEGLDLTPVYKVLEEKTCQKLQRNETLRCYEFSLLLEMFSGNGGGCGVQAADTLARVVDEEKLLSLYFELTGPRFGDKQAEKIKYYVNIWGLDHLYAYMFVKGLDAYFKRRYIELSGNKDAELDLQGVLAVMPAADILEEEKLIEDFVFDQMGAATLQDGLKEDLLQEKTHREKAQAILDELYGMLGREQYDYLAVLELMKNIHLDRQIKIVERLGLACLRKHIKENAAEGAVVAARRFGFSPPETLDEKNREGSLRALNGYLLSQCRASGRGRDFLRWESVLDHCLVIEQANCYTARGGYLLLRVSPVEDVEHFLFGYYPLTNDRHQFIRDFLREFLEQENFIEAAGNVIRNCLERMSGRIRLRNAGKSAALAFPVMLTVAILVGWVYNLAMGNLGEGVLLAAGILLLGEAIAVRNGLSMEVKAEDSEAIPEYACRDQGILKIRPSAARKKAAGH